MILLLLLEQDDSERLIFLSAHLLFPFISSATNTRGGVKIYV